MEYLWPRPSRHSPIIIPERVFHTSFCLSLLLFVWGPKEGFKGLRTKRIIFIHNFINRKDWRCWLKHKTYFYWKSIFVLILSFSLKSRGPSLLNSFLYAIGCLFRVRSNLYWTSTFNRVQKSRMRRFYYLSMIENYSPSIDGNYTLSVRVDLLSCSF